MSEKRIPRKHFLAAIGAAVVGAVGARGLFSGRGVKSSATVAMHSDLPEPATDPRAVARPSTR